METESGLAWIEDGILFYVFKKTVLGVYEAMDCVAAKVELCGGKSLPMIINLIAVEKTTDEVQAFLSNRKTIENITAVALISPTLMNGLSVSLRDKFQRGYFITFNDKAGVTVKLSTDENEAIKWLQMYRRDF